MSNKKNGAISKCGEHPLIAEMPIALRESCECIRQHLNAETYSELRSEHAIGLEVQKLHDDPQKYGADPVGALARVLDLDLNRIYSCRKIVQAWPKWEEVEELRKRKSVVGQKIKFTHLAIIAHERESKRRSQLLKMFFSKGLSVRQLLQEVQPKSKRRPGRATTPAAGLKRMEKIASDYGEFFPEWDEIVFDRIDEAITEKFDASLLESITIARDSQEQLQKQVGETLKKLNRRIRDIEDLRAKTRRSKPTMVPAHPPVKDRSKAQPDVAVA